MTRSTAGPSLTPVTFAKATVIFFSPAGWANCSEARRCSVPPCESVAVTDFRPRPVSVTWISQRSRADDLDVGRDADLRRLGLEARPQDDRRRDQRDDDYDEEDDDEREFAAGTSGCEGVHEYFMRNQ